MSELADLERRITDALDRIGAGLEQLDASAPDSGANTAEMAALSEALEAEKTANAQLEERVKTLRRKNEARIKELEDEVDDIKAAAADTVSQLKQAQHDLAALRKEKADAVSEGEAGKQALTDELAALRRMRDTDRAELDAVITELKPLLEEDTHA